MFNFKHDMVTLKWTTLIVTKEEHPNSPLLFGASGSTFTQTTYNTFTQDNNI